MAAKMSKEAKKFVTLLASRLDQDDQRFEDQELVSFFEDAVSDLPKSGLKSALEKDFHLYSKQLSSTLGSKKISQKTESLLQTTFAFNLFAKGGINKALTSAKELHSNEARAKLYKSLWACYPILEDSRKLFSTLEEDGPRDDLEAVQKYTQISMGCCKKKNVLESLSLILREFSSKCDECINDKASDPERCVLLKEALHRYIILMNYRWKSCTDDISAAPDESYEDLMAAMLSWYIDMVLFVHRDDAQRSSTAENLASLLFVVLGHSPEHCMDVLLQANCHTNNGETVAPLLRCVLERNTKDGPLKLVPFVKFVCLARLGLQICSSNSTLTDTAASIHKVAETQAAPARFVALLSQLNKRLVEKLRLTKKMRPSHVTTHLLGEHKAEDMEEFLDIATDTVHLNDKQNPEDHGPSEKAQGDHTSADQPLFFIDSSGGQEDTEGVDVGELKHEDVILHRQLNRIIQNLQQDSDYEEDLESVVSTLHLTLNKSNAKSQANGERALEAHSCEEEEEEEVKDKVEEKEEGKDEEEIQFECMGDTKCTSSAQSLAVSLTTIMETKTSQDDEDQTCSQPSKPRGSSRKRTATRASTTSDTTPVKRLTRSSTRTKPGAPANE